MKIAVLGHGVVGSGVVEVLLKNEESITKKSGEKIEVKYILDIKSPSGPLADKFVNDVNIILNDDEVKIVAETMGGVDPAYSFVKSALVKGKSVVTSNKELVAKFGAELLQTARDYNCNFMFEASVGGGIPIIRPLQQCLSANEIDEVQGILNGTTNFILTKMINDGMSLDDALALATDLGYAEKSDPSADTEGHDACRKIAILASLIFGKEYPTENVLTEGITALSIEDVKYANSYGCVIKLIGQTKRIDDGRIYAMVSPCFIKKTHPLANVDDVFNGIYVKGNAIGNCMFYGPGAGKLPTASAVVADIIDCTKHIDRRKDVFWEPVMNIGLSHIISTDEIAHKYFVRLNIKNRDKALEFANEIFGDVHEITHENSKGELAFITKEIPEGIFKNKLDSIIDTPDVNSVISTIRVLSED